MLLEKIQQDLKAALKAGEKIKVSTLRFLLAELHNRWIDKKDKFSDEDVIAAIRMQIKQRKEAIALYQKGGRNDLVSKEKEELEILSKYLPQQLSLEELEKIVIQTISELKAGGIKDFGRVMGAVMAKVKGQAEGAMVAEEVKKYLKIEN